VVQPLEEFLVDHQPVVVVVVVLVHVNPFLHDISASKDLLSICGYDKIYHHVLPAGNVCGVGTLKDTASYGGCIHALCAWGDIFPCHKVAEKFCQQQQLVVIRKFAQKLIFSSMVWHPFKGQLYPAVCNRVSSGYFVSDNFSKCALFAFLRLMGDRSHRRENAIR